jgi:glucan phosphorylase
VNPELSTATFDGEVVEIRKIKDKDEWLITMGKDRIPGKPFSSRERAIRHVNNMVEKVISANMLKVKAKQRPLSPVVKH